MPPPPLGVLVWRPNIKPGGNYIWGINTNLYNSSVVEEILKGCFLKEGCLQCSGFHHKFDNGGLASMVHMWQGKKLFLSQNGCM